MALSAAHWQKLINAMNHILPVETILVPSFAPKGCIDISAPRVNRERPKIKHIAPIEKSIIVPASRGVTNMESRRIMTTIGSIELVDSANLCFIGFIAYP